MELKATARAWAPGHITGLFGIADTAPDPLQRGSRGAGLSLSAGVTTEVRLDQTAPDAVTIGINERTNAEAPVSRRVIGLFFEACGQTAEGSISVSHRIDIPQGAGFGSSGAGALSLALALNAAAGSPLSGEQAAQIAHRAEVECRTGLGTVLACTVGGLEIRTRAGAPGVGAIRSFALPAGLTVLSLVKGPLSTAAALSDQALREKINSAYAGLADELLAHPDVDTFLRASRRFTDLIGLATPAVREIMTRLNGLGLTSGMHMFGEAVFTLLGPDQRSLIGEIARWTGVNDLCLVESLIAPQGGKVIHEQ
jgi:pantoate kinase